MLLMILDGRLCSTLLYHVGFLNSLIHQKSDEGLNELKSLLSQPNPLHSHCHGHTVQRKISLGDPKETRVDTDIKSVNFEFMGVGDCCYSNRSFLLTAECPEPVYCDQFHSLKCFTLSILNLYNIWNQIFPWLQYHLPTKLVELMGLRHLQMHRIHLRVRRNAPK